MDGLKSEHIHYVFGKYIKCENPFHLKELMKHNKTARKFSFSSKNKKGELMLHLDSDFG